MAACIPATQNQIARIDAQGLNFGPFGPYHTVNKTLWTGRQLCHDGVAAWGYSDPPAQPDLEPREAAHAVCLNFGTIVYRS